MHYYIANEKEVADWLQEQIASDHDMHAIKGKPLPYMSYDDGYPIAHDINIGWRNVQTNEEIYFDYQEVKL